MNALEERIAQWERMAAEAPDDMAYFSLGNAYKDAERFEDAEQAFAKAIELNPGMSRAYQVRAQTLIKLDRNEEAIGILTTGYVTAAERGDVMPQRAMGALLEKLEQPIPETRSAEDIKAEAEATGDMVLDRRTGRSQPRLAGPPMRGPVGQFIFDHFGQITWNQWIGQGTKVINELRLDFSNQNHQEIYEQHMLEWLQINTEEIDDYDQKEKG